MCTKKSCGISLDYTVALEGGSRSASQDLCESAHACMYMYMYIVYTIMYILWQFDVHRQQTSYYWCVQNFTCFAELLIFAIMSTCQFNNNGCIYILYMYVQSTDTNVHVHA